MWYILMVNPTDKQRLVVCIMRRRILECDTAYQARAERHAARMHLDSLYEGANFYALYAKWV